jgi:hypothetical protein
MSKNKVTSRGKPVRSVGNMKVSHDRGTWVEPMTATAVPVLG